MTELYKLILIYINLNIFALSFTFTVDAQVKNLNWHNIKEGSFICKGEKLINSGKHEIFKSKFEEIKAILKDVPFESINRSQNYSFIIELPLPNGEMSKFYITEYSMMEEFLALQYSDTKTFNLKGIDDAYSVGKLDITMNGLHGMVLSPNGDFFIDPYSTNEKDVYISYFKSDYVSQNEFRCMNSEIYNEDYIFEPKSILIATGTHLRTYRLAIAATGEYTAYLGGTISAAMSAIITALNRINGLYERDVAVRMTLVSNNSSIIYTNSLTDPYSPPDKTLMLSQNQSNLDSVIGSSNYDLGHVCSTGNEGIASLGVVCRNGIKARGVTFYDPVNNPNYIFVLGHEIGHQFGANHTFNGTLSNCSGNRNSLTAWEPGAGTTIMSYFDRCGSQNIQSYVDVQFHTGSISEIATYTQLGQGNSCPDITNTGNTPPNVNVSAGGYTIPKNTPFQLSGSATDDDSQESLTYCWEQFDLGPPGAPNSPSGNAPIFRSFVPLTSPTRIFPQLSDLLNNTQTLGEILPSYARSLNFRLTVRDNNFGGGGVNYGLTAFNVTASAGPFTVTQPNTNVLWTSTSPQTILWSVANTNLVPVNCTSVNIKLSTNGGTTYSITLAANTSNDGSEIVNLPSVITTQARIKIEAVGNIFFDISNTDFKINSALTPPALEELFNQFTFAPAGWTILFSGTSYWSRGSVSAYGIGSGSAKYDCYTGADNQILVSPTFNSTVIGDSLKFDHAYGPYIAGVDSLIIDISTNGGASYNNLVRLFGTAGTGTLNTAPTNFFAFTPTSDQWATKKYSLPIGTNKIRFRARSGFDGNNIYLDNIFVGNISGLRPAVITLTEEGFYNPSTNTLSLSDTVNVYLRSSTIPYVLIDSGKTEIDSVTFKGSLIFKDAPSGVYYIVIRHRNVLETWSKSGGESYTRGSSFNYNFTSSISQAFGSNMKQVDFTPITIFAFYSGDFNQDGFVNLTDVIGVYNDASSFTNGYVNSDMNGDNVSDLTDIIITHNNSSNFVSKVKP